MDLVKFEEVIRKMISENELNLSVSGVALVSNLKEQYWSASLIVDREGKVPPARKENWELARSIFQDCAIRPFYLEKVFEVKFRMADGTLGYRWQVQYLFRA